MDYKNILFIVATVAAAVAAYAVVEMRSAEVDQSNVPVVEVVKTNPVNVAREQAANAGEEVMEKMEKEATSTEEVMEKEGEEVMEKDASSTEEVMEKDA